MCITVKLKPASCLEPHQHLIGSSSPPCGSLEEELETPLDGATAAQGRGQPHLMEKGSLLRCKTTWNNINTSQTRPFEGKLTAGWRKQDRSGWKHFMEFINKLPLLQPGWQ